MLKMSSLRWSPATTNDQRRRPGGEVCSSQRLNGELGSSQAYEGASCCSHRTGDLCSLYRPADKLSSLSQRRTMRSSQTHEGEMSSSQNFEALPASRKLKGLYSTRRIGKGWFTLTIALIALALIFSLLIPGAAAVSKKVSICIKNCQYCKEMYHDHFDGGMCADFCVRGRGRHIVDCGVENSIVPFFLQRLE
ncbi:uncharacterized protein LOC108674453 [Hyalella azteca]|uniref:Uncharacterized protein LOC108674453 n=1 Tax=Hyalella azteca TaxID=294128 RepID=A0A8B7NYD4_HYAAZ|nr:uncharacterized protein LOC108674453 [Hyalella azteca]